MNLSPQQFEQIAKDTSKPNSGATIDVKTGKNRESGWAVAMPGHEETVSPEQHTGANLAGYTERHAADLEKHGNLGIWTPKKSRQSRLPGRTVLDTTSVKPNTYAGGIHAIAQGFAGKQESIFNLDRYDTLSMNPAADKERPKSAMRETRHALTNLKRQRVEPVGRVAAMETGALGDAIYNRQPMRGE